MILVITSHHVASSECTTSTVADTMFCVVTLVDFILPNQETYLLLELQDHKSTKKRSAYVNRACAAQFV